MNAHEFPANVSRETFERLETYRALLSKWQKSINLVGKSTLADSQERHFRDSLQLKPLLQAEERVVDLGSGAGFPGLVIAMLLAESSGGSVDLIESSGKKCAFLREVVRETGLSASAVKVSVHHSRIEHTLSNFKDISLITARALAPLSKLLEYTEGRIAGNTRALFPKGEKHALELQEAEKEWTFDAILHKSEISAESVILEIRNAVCK